VPLSLELGGLNTEREFLTTRLDLPPLQRVLVQPTFYSLAYVHAVDRPEARIGMHSPALGAMHLISSPEWGNIWIYGMEILLAGWLTHGEFRRRAALVNTGMRTMQFDRTRVKNLSVPLLELEPLLPFLEQLKKD